MSGPQPSGSQPSAPSATGTLAKTPAVHLLAYIMERALAGTLHLRAQGGSVFVVFTQGAPYKVQLDPADLFLSNILEDLGFCTPDVLQRSFAEAQAARMLHGQYLLQRGAIQSQQLDLALRSQIERKLARIFFLDDTTEFAYYDGVDLAAQGTAASAALDPLGVIWLGMRQRPPRDHVQAALPRLQSGSLVIRQGAPLERYGFRPNELALARALLEQPRTLNELLAMRVMGAAAVQSLLYGLLMTKQLDVVGAPVAGPSPSQPPISFRVPAAAPASSPVAVAGPVQVPPPPRMPTGAGATGQVQAMSAAGAAAVHPSGSYGAVRHPSPAGGVPKPILTPSGGTAAAGSVRPGASGSLPPPMSAEDQALKKEVQGKLAAIVSQDFFQMLGVDKNADVEAVNKAYYALAKKWHPDRLPSTLESVKADCAKVFSHLSEAHQTLTDAKRREDYLVLLKEGGATPEAQKQIQGVLEAITLFQKAEILFKTRDFVQAETLARKALALDPRQAEYLAFVTWIDALKPENQPVEPTRKLIEAMSNAIKLSASCEKAYFYRGMLYKRIDQHALAIKDFKKSSELNPNNVDAAREVRLFYMRGGRSVPPAPGSEPLAGKASGLFGKFFKK